MSEEVNNPTNDEKEILDNNPKFIIRKLLKKNSAGESVPESIKKPGLELDSDGNKITLETHDFLTLPLAGLEEIITHLEQSEINGDDPDPDEKTSAWLNSISSAIRALSDTNRVPSPFNRDGGDWSDHIEASGKELKAHTESVGKIMSGQSLHTNQAVEKARQLLGRGMNRWVPLFASGIWLRIQAPSSASSFLLEETIAAEKAEIGRLTNGISFSNDNIYIVNIILDHILEHVIGSSIGMLEPEQFKSLIKITDIPNLITEFAALNYPRGFNFSQPCTANTKNCMEVTQELINIRKLVRHDMNKLTLEQKDFMRDYTKHKSIDEIIEYQKSFDIVNTKAVEIQSVTFVLKTPVFATQQNAGFKWAQELQDAVIKTMSGNESETKRRRQLDGLTRATMIRLYVHWIDEIILTEEGNSTSITERKIIDEIVNDIIEDHGQAKLLLDKLKEFMSSTIVSYIGIPNFECPKCHYKHIPSEGWSEYLIPVDPIAIFFTLLRSRLAVIRTQL